ncbi:Lrp/AsnC family transcriptional regulator [Oceaniovalibus sp. ACAM 378]|uniref:Lrp/AsnC family transcriptional regulator n=1 Tax=Oceaniovalibus sp. ACAM 378 TaxID=2599923 RepID=UPI0011D58FA8|nr:Lrp/AsnC family transcriptional regulator [Oceaniovalibus sp. ACAM 378]TYB85075.1 Lrp/AsnC family transcriptional regulator [Oceaniovalibus sp. ACAM 378]
MDELDQRLLAALVGNSSTSTSQLARRFKVARSTVQARIERLESTGVIAGYTVKLGRALSLKRVRATVLVQLEPRTVAAVIARLRDITEIETVHSTTGRIDLILQLAAETTEDLDQTLDRIVAIPGVRDTESLIHLSTKVDRPT